MEKKDCKRKQYMKNVDLSKDFMLEVTHQGNKSVTWCTCKMTQQKTLKSSEQTLEGSE